MFIHVYPIHLGGSKSWKDPQSSVCVWDFPWKSWNPSSYWGSPMDWKPAEVELSLPWKTCHSLGRRAIGPLPWNCFGGLERVSKNGTEESPTNIIVVYWETNLQLGGAQLPHLTTRRYFLLWPALDGQNPTRRQLERFGLDFHHGRSWIQGDLSNQERSQFISTSVAKRQLCTNEWI